MKFIIIFLCIAVLNLVINDDIFAHGIRGEIISKTGTLVKAEYDDGESMSYAAVEIFCCEKKLPYQTGRTDRNGQFLFLPDKPGIWDITVKDDMGHQLQLKTSIGENNLVRESRDNHLQSCTRYQKALTGIAVLSIIFSFFYWWKGRKGF